MTRLQVAIFVLAFAPLTTSQEQKPEKPPPAQATNTYQAPISCTANVPAALCKVASKEFGAVQQASKVMEQVEIVIADAESFKQETDRLASRQRQAMQVAAKTNDTANFFGMASRAPTAPSGLEGFVLFVLEDNGLRKIGKVVVSSELFRNTTTTDERQSANSNSHSDPSKYDSDLVYMWSKYIAGYAEGWFWGRMAQLSEESAAPPK